MMRTCLTTNNSKEKRKISAHEYEYIEQKKKTVLFLLWFQALFSSFFF